MGWGMEAVGVADLVDDLDDISDSLTQTEWKVGTTVEYAIYLETGTSKMKPYKFMAPAVEKVMNEQADKIADSADSVDEVVSGIAFAIEAEAKHFASTGVSPGPDEVTSNLKNSIRAERL